MHLAAFDKKRQSLNAYDEQISARLSKSHKNQFAALGGLVGITLPLLIGIPMLCVITPPMMAVWGYEQFYNIDELVTGLLGLSPFTSTAAKLTFLVTWFLVGSAILHIQFYLCWKHWDKVKGEYA
jgi:hypothetical protein